MSDDFFGTPTEQNQSGMVLDLTDTDENGGSFDPVPQGIYPAVLSEAEFVTSSAGNPMITWVWTVEDGHEYAERKFWYHTTLHNDNGLSRLKKLILRIAPTTDLSKFDVQNDPPDLIGARARLKVGLQMYQGERRNNVKDVLTPVEQGSGMFDE